MTEPELPGIPPAISPHTGKPYSMTPGAVQRREHRARQKRDRKIAEASALAPAALASQPGTIEDALVWIEDTLIVPSGPLAGQPFRLPGWQKDWARAAYAEAVREAGMSIARKNGKSGLVGALLLAHLAGPLTRADWRGVVASLTGPLAKELRDAVELTAQASGLADQIKLTKSPPPGMLTGKHGAEVRFLAADRATGHAIGSDLAIIDEAGLLQENKRALWNALLSSTSGRDGRFWGISIQGDGPMFAEMEERADAPYMHWTRYSAPLECDLDDEAAWEAANPGIVDGIKSRGYMARQADRARAAPANEANYRAYDLNQDVDPERETIVAVSEYVKCIEDAAVLPSGDIVVGIDLGGSASMTCACALDVHTGAIMVRGAFGDDPPLSQRARNDRMGARYDSMVRAGELKLYPGKVTPVVAFLRDFFAEVAPLGRIVAVGCDRFRRAEAEQALTDARIPAYAMHWRGQGAGGTADGSHDVVAFQKRVKGIKLRVGNRGSPMLEAAIANSILRYDGAGNAALDKRNSKARIDAASAAVIAAGLAELMPDAPLFRVHVV